MDYGKDHTLFALREGNVKITKELVDRPEWFKWGEGPYFERTFVHVEERTKARRIVCKNPDSLAAFLSWQRRLYYFLCYVIFVFYFAIIIL